MCRCLAGGGLPTTRHFPHHIRRRVGPSAAGGKGKQLDGELDDGVDSPVPHHLRAAYAHPHPTVLWQDILLRYWKHWRHKDFGISASRERYFWSLFMHVCMCVSVCVSVPAGSPSLDWDVTLYVLDVDQPSMSVCVFVALSTVFHFMNSPHNSSLSHSALLVLFLPYWPFWTMCVFMKVSLSPDIILCGWLGLKHQLTN